MPARCRQSPLARLDAQLERTGVAGDDRAFNVSWHDWINLKNLVAVGRVIATAALAREDSRGAHYRDDFPAPGDLSTSHYFIVSAVGSDLALQREPVRFTRVRPGDSLLVGAASDPGTASVATGPAVSGT